MDAGFLHVKVIRGTDIYMHGDAGNMVIFFYCDIKHESDINIKTL